MTMRSAEKGLEQRKGKYSAEEPTLSNICFLSCCIPERH
jgi:hypothetical protein